MVLMSQNQSIHQIFCRGKYRSRRRERQQEGEAEEAVRGGSQERGAEGCEAEEQLRTQGIPDLLRAAGMTNLLKEHVLSLDSSKISD